MDEETTQPERPRNEIHRIAIPQPMSATPYTFHCSPRPHLSDGTRVQVTAFTSEHGEIVERWQFSDTDVRWYRLEAYQGKWVTLKVDKRTPVG